MLKFRVIKHYCATGCGRTGPDPTADITLEDGTIVPVGKGTSTSVANTSLLYNEYPLALTTLRPLRFISIFFRLSLSSSDRGEKTCARCWEEKKKKKHFVLLPIALCTHPMFCFIFFPFVYSQSHSLSLVDFKSLNRHIPYLLSLLKPLLMVRTI